MTLSTLLSDLPPLASLRGLWLVFPAALGDALTAAQQGQTLHRVEPITLTDGRLALCADLLTETGGIYAAAFSQLNPTNFAMVEVLPDADFRELLPEESEP